MIQRHELWTRIRSSVVKTGHYILSSKQHSDVHANFVSGHLPPAIRQRLVKECCDEVDDLLLGRWTELVVVGTGCGYWYAAMVAERLGVSSVYTERDRYGHFTLRRDMASIVQGKNVLLIDDVLLTGTTVRSIMSMLQTHDVRIIGLLFLLNRGVSLDASSICVDHPNVPVRALFHDPLPAWDRAQCQLCQDGIPFSTEYGAGEDEFHRHGQPIKS